jgi:hypothetical protein
MPDPSPQWVTGLFSPPQLPQLRAVTSKPHPAGFSIGGNIDGTDKFTEIFLKSNFKFYIGRLSYI